MIQLLWFQRNGWQAKKVPKIALPEKVCEEESMYITGVAATSGPLLG